MKGFLIPLTEPLGAIWALTFFFAIVLAARKQWRSAVWLGIPLGLIFLIGSTPLAKLLVSSAEQALVQKSGTPATLRALISAKTDPTNTAIVVLGGGHRVSPRDPLGFAVTGAGNRILTGMELTRSGVANTLVLGGHWTRPGQVESGMAPVQRWLESLDLRDGLTITNLGICRDTREEAVGCRRVVPEPTSVLLVTSALHMRRSVAAFRKAGINVVPFPCDFQAYGVEDLTPWSPFPRVERFQLLSQYLHEQVGWWVYKLRGWV